MIHFSAPGSSTCSMSNKTHTNENRPRNETYIHHQSPKNRHRKKTWEKDPEKRQLYTIEPERKRPKKRHRKETHKRDPE